MTLALALVLAAQAATTGPPPAAAVKKTAPMTFQVQADAKGGAAAKAWADELRTAVHARKDEFRPAKPGEKPDVLVRVDSVASVANGANVMNGALVVGGTPTRSTSATRALRLHRRRRSPATSASTPSR